MALISSLRSIRPLLLASYLRTASSAVVWITVTVTVTVSLSVPSETVSLNVNVVAVDGAVNVGLDTVGLLRVTLGPAGCSQL